MGGIGHAISNAFGSNNEADVKAPAQMYQVKDNSFEYGGAPGQARVAAAEAGNTADEQRRMAAESTGQKNELYGYGRGELGNAEAARGFQVDALTQARNRAAGNDLISTQVANEQARKLAQDQASTAASARGPGGIALAGQTQAANTALGTSNIANTAAINAANERLGYSREYANQAAGIRGTDLGAANTALGAGVGYGNLGVSQGGLGLGYSNLQNQINTTQLGAQMQKEALQSGNQNAAQALNAQVAGQNAAMAQKNAEGAVSLGTSLFSAAAKAKGGPVSGGKPYLVGERGPEIIVPNHDGYVIPNNAISRVTGYRAEGGPVEGGRAYGVGEHGVEAVVPATWGGGPDLTAQSRAANAHAATQQALTNQSIGMSGEDPFRNGMDPTTRQTLAGMPGTLGLELGTNVYGGQAPTGADSYTQMQMARGMAAAGVPSKALMRQAKATETVEKGKAIAPQSEDMGGNKETAPKTEEKKPEEKKEAPKGLGDRLSGAVGNWGKSLGYGQGGVDVSFHSDENAKLGIMPVGDLGLTSSLDMGPANFGKLSLGSKAGSGPVTNPTGDYAMKGGGMDVGGTFKAINQHTIDANNHPGSSPTSYSDMTTKTPMMMSDAAAKADAYRLGRQAGIDEGQRRAVDNFTGTAGKAAEQAAFTGLKGGLSVAGGAEEAADKAYEGAKKGVIRGGEYANQAKSGLVRVLGNAADNVNGSVDAMHEGTADAIGAMYPAPAGPPPQQVYEVQSNAVNREAPRALVIDHAASTKKKFQGSDERTKEVFKKEAPMAAANRSQEGFSYAYKPQFTPPEQSQGERNVGPMAQNMAANPIARTAVKKNPEDGMLMLDNNKLAKLHSASIASLQDQIDALHAGVARVLGRGR